MFVVLQLLQWLAYFCEQILNNIGISFQYFLIQLINEFEKVHMSKAKGQQYQENQHILFHFG